MHQTVRAIEMLQRLADEPNTDDQTAKFVKKFGDDFSVCREVWSSPRRLKLAVVAQELTVNHPIQVDVMYIGGRSVIYIVDEATHFCSDLVFCSQSTKQIWKTIQQISFVVLLNPRTTWLRTKDLRTHQRKWRIRQRHLAYTCMRHV